jgi:hypothetical protein
MAAPNLSENQQQAVLRAVQPLPPFQREAFYAAVAQFFRGRDDLVDGELFRALIALQREHLRYPIG